jgi:transglutaminase/protease-like cytokinesis protein 3
VKQNITRKDFSQAFASAAEVARTRHGDCTEHALLLAALARACGIPARVAVGLVYVEGSGVFGYHMWTEVFVSNTWIPVDATLGRGGIGAAHLKLAQSSLEGGDACSSFLPVLNVMGRLRIQVLSEE